METVVSKDDTTIAYDRYGDGPPFFQFNYGKHANSARSVLQERG